MSRYIDADKLMITLNDWWYSQTKIESQNIPYDDYISVTIRSAMEAVKEQPTADVRKNIKAKKVIGGGEHDGATCWFECSSCHGSVDIEDAYCKHCGAVLEYEK